METVNLEAEYPITFHEKEARELGQHLKSHHSVVLIGMKRVGISNFLRFFLYHKDIATTYIGDGKKHLFIHVDLNNLVEREIPAFWTLTLKRIVDSIENTDIPGNIKDDIESLFMDSIQSQDLFITIDSVRKSLMMLVEQNIEPTLFFVLFDRMQDAITVEFFANLQGIQDAVHDRLSYVFTSFRSLDVVSPQVFTRPSLVVFSHDSYIRPAKRADVEIVFETLRQQYDLAVSDELREWIFELVDGYMRYLHLALIHLNEKKPTDFKTKEELFKSLLEDERIYFQSEELWESLSPQEQEVLVQIEKKQKVSEEKKKQAKYVWDTGFIFDGKGKWNIFSPLFEHYVSEKVSGQKSEGIVAGTVEFTKKEHLLFDYLKKNINDVCEREKIIEAVWPEVEALGVSDWAVDRLVARVRNKMKEQQSKYEIQTIKTRGYKLVSTE